MSKKGCGPTGNQDGRVALKSDDNIPISGDNPLPTSDIDSARRGSANSVFGDKITGRRIPSIAAQFQYGLRSDDAVVDIVGSGTTAFADAMLVLNTGIDVDGHIGLQGADYLRYIPGHEAYTFFTCIFASPVVDSVQRIGLFDYDGGNGNGFFIGFGGVDFGITRRRAGVDYFTPVAISDVFPEPYIFDPTKGNIFKISYGYLGFAPITFEVLLPNKEYFEFASIDYPNSATETHIANTNIPLRAEMTNTGNTTDLEMKIGSVTAGIVDGGGADPIARWFSFAGAETPIGSGITPLVTFRNKSTFFGLTNKISTQLALISSATDGVKPVGWKIEKNPTITVPGTWTDINTTDSVMEYSTDAVTTEGSGDILIPWAMGREDSFFEKIEDLNIKLRPNEWATIYTRTTAANDVIIALRWKELF